MGKTVGSIAAPVYGGLASDLLPDAQVTVLGGQSGHMPDDPDLNAEILGELWGAYDNMPDWKVNEGLTARDWGPPRFWVQAGLHDPEIVLARFDYAYDRSAAEGAEARGQDPSKLLASIDANEAAIEEAGVVLHSYTAPGDGHGILEWPTVLRAGGQRREAGRLGGQADRGQTSGRRALPEMPRQGSERMREIRRPPS